MCKTEREKEREAESKREKEGQEREKSILCIKATLELINNSRSVKKHPIQIQIPAAVRDAS